MRKLAKKFLSRLGFAIVTESHIQARYDVKRLPRTNIAALQLALGWLLSHTKKANLKILQVGANDGVTDDPLRSFLLTHDCDAWLLEPLPDVCERLRKNYAGKTRIKIFSEALTDQESGSATLYVPQNGENPDKFASFTRDFHKRIRIDAIRNSQLREVPVRTINIADFCRRESVPHFDVIQIDAEGMDARLVHSVLAFGLRPTILNFESLHIDKPEADALFPIIKSAGYVWIHDNLNTCCLLSALVNQTDSQQPNPHLQL